MFNTSNRSNRSNQSSDRSFRRDRSQRAPNTQKSRSNRSMSTSSRHSDPRPQIPQFAIPVWVHCEKCFDSHDTNPNMLLLSCGHILCRRCLRVDNCSLHPNDNIACLRCKKEVSYRPIDGSMDQQLRGMFQQSWMDPVLQLNLKHMQFMMTKSQNYNKYLAQIIKQNDTLPPDWQERCDAVKAAFERIKKFRRFEKEIDEKTAFIQAEAAKKFKSLQTLRALYQRKKTEIRQRQEQERRQQLQQQQRQPLQQQRQPLQQQRQPLQQQRQPLQQQRQPLQQQRQLQPHQRQTQQHQSQKGQVNYQKDMKFVSSGRNEQSNPYIGQVKSSHRRGNQSSANIRNSSIVTPPQRPNSTFDQHRDDTSKLSLDSGSRKSAMQSATFRPKTKNFKPDNRRFEPQTHGQSQAQKRLVPSYGYDGCPTPAKRATNYPVQRAMHLDTSISSVGSSQILSENPMAVYDSRPSSTLRNMPYK